MPHYTYNLYRILRKKYFLDKKSSLNMVTFNVLSTVLDVELKNYLFMVYYSNR